MEERARLENLQRRCRAIALNPDARITTIGKSIYHVAVLRLQRTCLVPRHQIPVDSVTSTLVIPRRRLFRKVHAADMTQPQILLSHFPNFKPAKVVHQQPKPESLFECNSCCAPTNSSGLFVFPQPSSKIRLLCRFLITHPYATHFSYDFVSKRFLI